MLAERWRDVDEKSGCVGTYCGVARLMQLDTGIGAPSKLKNRLKTPANQGLLLLHFPLNLITSTVNPFQSLDRW